MSTGILRTLPEDQEGRLTELTWFSTRDLPGHGFTLWRDRLRRSLGEISGRSGQSDGFTAWSKRLVNGNFVLLHMYVDAQSIELPTDRVTGHWRNSIHAVFPLSGRFHLEQAGHGRVIQPGSWCVYDPSIGFKSSHEQPVEMLAMVMPREMMKGLSICFESRALQSFSAEEGGGRIAKDYLASLLDSFPGGQAVLSSRTCVEYLSMAVQLIRLGMLENPARQSKGGRRALLRAQVQAYIDRNLRDPELSVDSIAMAQKCSKRYLHKLFSEGQGQTLSDYIRQARLERCRHDLANQELAHLSITEIAFSWGFQHQGHFSRVFRAQFKVSPSECRREGFANHD